MTAEASNLSDLFVHDDHDHDHDHGPEDSDGVVLAKGVAMAVLFCASMICGLIPLLLARKLRWVSAAEATDMKSKNRVIMILLSFGGGVLLSTTFLHVVPEVDEGIQYLQGVYFYI